MTHHPSCQQSKDPGHTPFCTPLAAIRPFPPRGRPCPPTRLDELVAERSAYPDLYRAESECFDRVSLSMSRLADHLSPTTVAAMHATLKSVIHESCASARDVLSTTDAAVRLAAHLDACERVAAGLAWTDVASWAGGGAIAHVGPYSIDRMPGRGYVVHRGGVTLSTHSTAFDAVASIIW